MELIEPTIIQFYAYYFTGTNEDSYKRQSTYIMYKHIKKLFFYFISAYSRKLF